MTLTGSYFAGTTSVMVNGISAAFTLIDSMTLSLVVPAETTSGPITVVNSIGTGVTLTSFTALPASSSSLNISTRLAVSTGDNVLIGGFIVSGTTPKKVLLRALGPSLADLNVPDVLADPVLELRARWDGGSQR